LFLFIEILKSGRSMMTMRKSSSYPIDYADVNNIEFIINMNLLRRLEEMYEKSTIYDLDFATMIFIDFLIEI
jgi:hypothetical protein